MNSRLECKASLRAGSPASAERKFSSEPYDAVRMRDVAAEIGKTTRALFQVFATKEDLRREAMGGEPPDLEPGQKVALLLRVHPGVTFNLRRKSRGYVFEATVPGRQGNGARRDSGSGDQGRPGIAWA